MKQMNFRITILRIAAAFVVLVLVYNLFQIQVIEGQEWADIADTNRFRHLVQTAPRGKIISADGVDLAGNIPSYSVALAYEQDEQKLEKTVSKLAELLDLDPEAIYAKLQGHRRRFEPALIASDLDFETVLLLEEHSHLMPGLDIGITPKRIYPQQTLLAHSLGRVNYDGFGDDGLEKKWEDYLRGKNGFSVIQVNAAGRRVGAPVNNQPAIPGNDLHLTIDAGLQQATQESLHQVLAKLREKYKLEDAWTGAVVVMDPNTGKILANVSEPSFDNNYRYNFKWPEELPQSSTVRTYRDRTIAWRRPVGSTFKMLTGLAALESGAVTAKETIRSTGVARIAGFSVPEYGYAAYGNVDMRRALEVSSNIYFGTLGNRLGREKIYDYIAKFGLTGVANGEINDSVVKNAGFDDISLGEQIHSLDYYKELLNRGEVFYSSYAVQMAYGQLNEFTVMQMANYVSMLANGGTHYKPYMVEKITSANGEVVELFEPTVLARQDFSPENLQVIREGMQAAAKGSRFRNLPFKIAGKTGTSQERGKDNHAWWVGYAPYDNPEIAIAINLEYGGLGLRCEEVARDIIDHYFGLKE